MGEYESMLDELGVDEKLVRSQSEITTDMIDFSTPSVSVKDSDIEGKGFFSEVAVEAGGFIFPARIGSCRTIAGRYSNHSDDPNGEMVVGSNGGITLVAKKEIGAGDEVTTDYRNNVRVAGRKQ